MDFIRIFKARQRGDLWFFTRPEATHPRTRSHEYVEWKSSSDGHRLGMHWTALQRLGLAEDIISENFSKLSTGLLEYGLCSHGRDIEHASWCNVVLVDIRDRTQMHFTNLLGSCCFALRNVISPHIWGRGHSRGGLGSSCLWI